MKKKQLIIFSLITTILASALGGWLIHYFSDKEVIKRQFYSTVRSLAKEGDEALMKTAVMMVPVKNILAPVCEIVVIERQYREQLEAGLIVHYIIKYRSRYSTLSVAIDELAVTIPSKNHAEVNSLMHLTANRKSSGRVDQTYRIEFSLSKHNKKWQVVRAVLPQTLMQTYSTQYVFNESL